MSCDEPSIRAISRADSRPATPAPAPDLIDPTPTQPDSGKMRAVHTCAWVWHHQRANAGQRIIGSLYCKGCLTIRLGLERNDRIGAPVGCVFDFSFFFCHLVSPLASTFHPPSRLDHRRKTNCKQITFRPTLTATRLPFFSHFFASFVL